MFTSRDDIWEHITVLEGHYLFLMPFGVTKLERLIDSLLLSLPAGSPSLRAPDVVRAHLVLQKPLLRDELVLAHVALERLLARVIHLVQPEILFGLEFLGAEPALKLGVLVGQLVLLTPGDVAEALAAVLALVLLVRGVGDVVVVGELLLSVEYHGAQRARERNLVVDLPYVTVQSLDGRVLVGAFVAEVVQGLFVHFDLPFGSLIP